MSKTTLSFEAANAIAAAIISRAQNLPVKNTIIELELPNVEMFAMPTAKKRGRPAKLKTAEETAVDTEADDYALSVSDSWMENGRQNRWSDDM